MTPNDSSPTSDATALWAQGNALFQQGRLEEAARQYRAAVSIDPSHAQAWHNLGVAAKQLGKPEDAIACFARAAAVDPGFLAAQVNLGHALEAAGRSGEAISAFERAVALRPGAAEGHNVLGIAQLRAKRLAEAEASFRRAVALDPSLVAAQVNLGNVLKELRRPREAAEVCRRALELEPRSVAGRFNLANALFAAGEVEEAIGWFHGLLADGGGVASVHSGLGAALEAAGRYDEALAAFERAVAMDPTSAEFHMNLSSLLLLRGDWARGWREYEWRWRWSRFGNPRPLPAEPMWDGGDLHGRTILLHAEQGFGDTIQLVRYVPIVAAKNGRVVFECPRELATLLRSVGGIDHFITQGDARPAFDVHCPLMSLPLALGLHDLGQVPAEVPYVRADAALVADWKDRLRAHATARGARLNVGLVWAGRGDHPNDHNRSIPPEALLPLAEVDGVAFHNLQKGEPRERGREMLSRLRAADWADDLRDFADSAALIDALDLLISADTAPAHLAGALGRPVWTLLPFKPEWRWLLDREDSPWYPSMRLFRQPAIGDWGSVVGRVVQELRAHQGS